MAADIYDAMTVSRHGVVVAVWMSGDPNGTEPHTVQASVRRPGHPWSTPRRLGLAEHDSRPSIVAVHGGSVVAAWDDGAGQAVLRKWHPHGGWAPAHAWSEHSAPVLASDPAANTWAVAGERTGADPSATELDVVVHPGGASRSTILATTACPSSVQALEVGVRGGVAATWTSGGSVCADDDQPEASHLAAGSTTWTTQDIGSCPFTLCSELDPFRAGRQLTLKQLDHHTDGSRSVTFWDLGSDGQWTQEPGDAPKIIGDVQSNRRGDLLSCFRGQHSKLWSRRAGHAWKQVSLLPFRVNGCAIDDHGRIVGIGNTSVGVHHLALIWGRVGQSRFRKVHLFRTSGYDSKDDNFPDVALTDHGLVTGLVSLMRSSHDVEVGVRARFSADAARGPAG